MSIQMSWETKETQYEWILLHNLKKGAQSIHEPKMTKVSHSNSDKKFPSILVHMKRWKSRVFQLLLPLMIIFSRKAHMSSKKLLEQCQKLEKLWNHVFTATTTLANITSENQWYNKLTDLIDKQQTAPIWMSESKVNRHSSTFVTHNVTHNVS